MIIQTPKTRHISTAASPAKAAAGPSGLFVGDGNLQLRCELSFAVQPVPFVYLEKQRLERVSTPGGSYYPLAPVQPKLVKPKLVL